MADRLITGAVAAPLAQMMGSDDGMGWGIVMMVAMLLFVVLVVVGVIWLVRVLLRDRERRSHEDGGPENSLRILDRRFADGEIEIDEYRERRSILERHG